MHQTFVTSRPIAQKRLDRALEEILASGPDQRQHFAYSDLRRKLNVIAQEKRFMLVLYLMREIEARTDYEIATGVRDQRSNVVRNLHALVSEYIVTPRRDEVTGIVRYRINHRTMNDLSELLRAEVPRPAATVLEVAAATD
jgi:hypothetical protein